jgi:hypothetical protein
MKKILITDLKLDIKNTNKVRNYFESKNGMLYSSIIKLLNFTNLLIILKVNWWLAIGLCQKIHDHSWKTKFHLIKTLDPKYFWGHFLPDRNFWFSTYFVKNELKIVFIKCLNFWSSEKTTFDHLKRQLSIIWKDNFRPTEIWSKDHFPKNTK